MIIIFLIHVIYADKLVKIQAIWRHGARTPLHCNWNCEYFNELDGLGGELTAAGIRQHFILGQWLRKRYIEDLKFLNENYDIDQIEVITSDRNRTIMSAMSNLLGLYPQNSIQIPQTKQEYLYPPNYQILQNDVEIKYQYIPIPFHMVDIQEDQVLRGFDARVCPKSEESKRLNTLSDLSRLLNQQTKELRTQFCQEMGITEDLDIFQIHQYMDTFHSCINNKFEMPKTLTQQTYDQLEDLFAITAAIYNYQTPMQQKLYATPFFQKLFEKFDKKQGFDFTIYSAHDTNIQLLLLSLNLTSIECMKQVYFNQTVESDCIYTFPGYASNIIFELWEDDKEQYIKLLYNGTYMKLCGQQQCSYNQFKKLITNNYVDYEKQCEINLDQKIVFKLPKIIIISFIMVIMGLGIVLIIIVQLRRTLKIRYPKQNQRKSIEMQFSGI